MTPGTRRNIEDYVNGVHALSDSELRKGWLRECMADIERLRRILSAILAADERGQGIPFAEAMEAAHKALKERRDGR